MVGQQVRMGRLFELVMHIRMFFTLNLLLYIYLGILFANNAIMLALLTLFGRGKAHSSYFRGNEVTGVCKIETEARSR